MKADIEIRTISPATAADLLANRFDGQRRVRPNYVAKLATEMAEGRWTLSCDAILLIKGHLANGQHRLEAVVLSKRSQQFIVMSSNDNELYKVIDSGIKRTVADVFVGSKYSREIPAIANLAIGYINGLVSWNGGGIGKTPRGEIVGFIEDNQKALTTAAEFATKLYSLSKLIPHSVLGAFYFLAKESNKTGVEEFLQTVIDGKGTGAASLMHHRAISNATSNRSFHKNAMFGFMIKAFKASQNGNDAILLKFKDGESFPNL